MLRSKIISEMVYAIPNAEQRFKSLQIFVSSFMQWNNKRKKSNEQKKWEYRKLKMAGIDVDDICIKEVDSLKLLYKNVDLHKYRIFEATTFDYTNEMYIIGNKQSLFYKQKMNTNLHSLLKIKANAAILPLQHNLSMVKSQTSVKVTHVDEYTSLPAYEYRHEIIESLKYNNVLVLTGSTGCGKSSVVPRILEQEFRTAMCITQPRRISVLSLYKRLEKAYKTKVGYTIRFDTNATKNSRIHLVTEGILLKELENDSILSKYNIVVCDEVHERTINIDIILAFIKLILKKRRDLKVVLMSATLHVDKFTDYFNCPCLSIDGKMFPVNISYLPVNPDDYIEWILKKILWIHKNQHDGDILVFISGKDDIAQLFDLLQIEIGESDLLEVISLHSEVLNEVYDRIFSCNNQIRKCILSTNVAETSVTIPNIKYVIDSGFCKINYYDQNKGNLLVKYPISKESAIQRAGRAGRVAPGECYRMYTKDTYENTFVDYNVPEIIRGNILNILLTLSSLKAHDLDKFPFICRPSSNVVNEGIRTLRKLGAIDERRNLTIAGSQILKLGIDAALGKLVLEGIILDCSYETSLLASILSIDPKLVIDFYLTKHEYFSDGNDFMSLIDLFKKEFKNTRRPAIAEKIALVHKNIIHRIKMLGYAVSSSNSCAIAILRAFYYNMAVRNGEVYEHLGSKIKLIPYKSIIDTEYVIFYNLYTTYNERCCMQICCNIDPQDVLKYASNHFLSGDDIQQSTIQEQRLYDRFVLEEEE